MKVQATKQISFCAGHRLMGHAGKCQFLHGHNYLAEVCVEGAPDVIGVVTDFSLIKNDVGGWIDKNWDHGMILNEKDLGFILPIQSQPHGKVFLTKGNPTAENMAVLLLKVAQGFAKQSWGVKVVSIKMWETPSSYAEVKA